MKTFHVAAARTDIELSVIDALELIRQLVGAVQDLHVVADASTFTAHSIYDDRRGACREVAGIVNFKVIK